MHQQEEEDARRNTISALNANGNEVPQQDAKADAPKTTIPEEIEIKVSKSADDVSTKPNSLATVVRRKVRPDWGKQEKINKSKNPEKPTHWITN